MEWRESFGFYIYVGGSGRCGNVCEFPDGAGM